VRRILRIVLPALALVLLAAHFFRGGLLTLAVLSLALVTLLFVQRSWALRALQAALALGALEWLRTAWSLASHRAAAGQPYGRMLLILGAVAAITVVAAVLAGRPRRAADDARRPV
jgi:hypothetical protein